LATGSVAADELITAAATDNERAEAYYYAGRAALRTGDTDQAVRAFEQCVHLERDIPEMNFAKALLRQLRIASPVATTNATP
jgi:tetratricopeptide (TPR) repeat protein